MHTKMNGAKSLEMKVGPDGGFRDICMAPESFLDLGLVTWVHHGDRTRVGPCVSTCQDSVSIMGACRGGCAAVSMAKSPWCSVSTGGLHIKPTGSSAFYLLGPCPLLSKREEFGVLHFLPAGPREERRLGCLCFPPTHC